MSPSLFRFAAVASSAFLALSVFAQQPSAKTPTPVAVISGQTIYDADLLPLAQPQLRPLRNQEYDIMSRALENLINQKLLEAEAGRKGISTEKLLEQEIDSKVSEPSEAELDAFYLGQKDRLNRPFTEVKPQLKQALQQARIQQIRQDYIKRLRDKADVNILLRPPTVELTFDPNRLRGNPRARVTIIEFSDFQCPYCKMAQATLKQVLEKYDGRVRLAFRDFPLRQIHAQAQLAAEGSRCAAEQGKFWEYHDQLFASSKLDRAELVEHARNLKLDDKQFESCLASGKFRGAIESDLQDGSKAGVSGTPGFFVNGVALTGAQPADAFYKIIDAALAAKP